MTEEVEKGQHPDASDLRRQGREAVEGPQVTREAVRDVVMNAGDATVHST